VARVMRDRDVRGRQFESGKFKHREKDILKKKNQQLIILRFFKRNEGGGFDDKGFSGNKSGERVEIKYESSDDIVG
jgi:hypothetical protein